MSVIQKAVCKHGRDFDNFEKLLRHEELEAAGTSHKFGVRKNVFGGHEFYLLEKLDKLTAKQALRHPSEVLKRLKNLAAEIKDYAYQKLRIDISSNKNAAYVQAFIDKVNARIDALPEKYQAFKPFGDRLGGGSNFAAAEARIAELEALNPERLQLENAGLREQINSLRANFENLQTRNYELNQQITSNAQQKEALERRIALLQKKVETKENKIAALEANSEVPENTHQHNVGEQVKEQWNKVVDHFKHHQPETKQEETKVENTEVEETKQEETKQEETKVENTEVEETKQEDTELKDDKKTKKKKHHHHSHKSEKKTGSTDIETNIKDTPTTTGKDSKKKHLMPHLFKKHKSDSKIKNLTEKK